MTPIFVRTKLHPPRLNREIVDRPALVQRLNAGLDRDLTLVIAPAGFGKTTLLTEWASQALPQVAWLALDEGDNDVATFIGYLVAAIQRVFPGACPDIQAVLHAPQLPTPGILASILTNEIDDLPDRFVLVLDDYHCISEPAVHQLLDSLLQHPPLQLHLLLASRSDPPLALPRLRANRAVSELRMADLRFSQQEAEAFLTQTLGVEGTAQFAAPLWERVQGWIAGLQLASLSIRVTPDSADLAQQLARGPNRFIMDYLFEQVLLRQPPDVQQFLVKTSILERLSPALTQAVMNADTPPETSVELTALARAGLFLTALDETDEWFQYHDLFREMLYHTLQQKHAPEDIANLQRRASLWFRQNNLIEEALRHALAAHDTELAAQLVAERFVDQLNRFDWRLLEHWLAQLPANVIETHPWLLVAEAYVLHYRSQWDAMVSVMKRVEQQLTASHGSFDPAEETLLQGYLDTLWSVHWMVLGEAELTKAAAQKAFYNLPATHTGAHELALLTLVSAVHSLGGFATAERFLNDMLAQEMRAKRGSPATLAVLFALVFNAMAEGHIGKLEQVGEQLRQTALAANVPFMQAWAYRMLGEAAYEANDLSRAAEYFAAGAALRYIAHTRAGHECLIGLALAQQARGRRDEAQGVVALLLDYHHELINPTLSAEGDSLQARLALMTGDMQVARRWWRDTDPEFPPGWIWYLEVPSITHLRVSIADRVANNLEATRQELDRDLDLVTRLHKPRLMVELLTLKALLLDRLEEKDEALHALEAALALSEPRGLVRAMAEAGPQLEPLLKIMARRSPSSYLDRVLAVLHPPIASGVSSQRVTSDLDQPKILLTHREEDVLALLGRRCTDREIAEALVISSATVRTHIEKLSGKLGVHGRRAVVARARELGLLTHS